MAVGAGGPPAGMGSAVDWESGVIKSSTAPRRGGVTIGAGLRKCGCDVIRIGRVVIFAGMAGIAIGRRALEYSVNVATGAGRSHMRSREGERGVLVIEG